MVNGTMEVATSLGAVAGRWVGWMIVRSPRRRNRSLSEVLDIATQTDARRDMN